jgi:excisionase family DNA binding protein
MSHQISGPITRRYAYSPEEAGSLLGVTRQTIYNLISRGELTSVKIGRSRRIPHSELERLLAPIGDGE